jgi:hypothetical protein
MTACFATRAPITTVLLLASTWAVAPASAPMRAQSAASGDAAVQRVVDDYIGLYRKETLERWKALFLPAFTASYTNADGSVSSRTLNEFYEAQRSGFAAGEMSETLQNVRIERVGHLAHASADFRFTSRGAGRDGKLMLLLIEEKGQLKIAALAFSYH